MSTNTTAPITSTAKSEDVKGEAVIPLPQSARGRNGTTKNGKTVAKKTGNPKTDAKPAAAKPIKNDAPAIVLSRRSRVTGTLVQLVNTTAAGSTIASKGELTWARVCADHQHVDFHATRSAARVDRSDPTRWCPKCKRAATKSATS